MVSAQSWLSDYALIAQGSLRPFARELAAQSCLRNTGSVSIDFVARHIAGTANGWRRAIVIACFLCDLSSHFHPPTQSLFRYPRPGHGEASALPRYSLRKLVVGV